MSEVLYVPSDGLTLAVETFGSGPALIFAHGLTGNRHITRAQFAPLADRYRIIIYDQRGHCDSTPVTDPALYHPIRMAEDMTAVLDALDVDTAIVGGESMGSATTVMFTLRHPERVKKLLLTAPAFGDTVNTEAAGVAEMGRSMLALGKEAYLAASATRQRDELGWPQPVIDAVARMHGAHDPASFATACEAVMLWKLLPDLELLKFITCPTCIIAWENDPLHPLELAQRYAATIPDSRLEMLPALVDLFMRPQVVGEIYGQFLDATQSADGE
ncbi:MAG: alpha/beta hydrolase [Anaerolineaceae bacterium]|nr:alpha/beta hydrolase [Anaerolineaceae bacterium]